MTLLLDLKLCLAPQVGIGALEKYTFLILLINRLPALLSQLMSFINYSILQNAREKTRSLRDGSNQFFFLSHYSRCRYRMLLNISIGTVCLVIIEKDGTVL